MRRILPLLMAVLLTVSPVLPGAAKDSVTERIVVTDDSYVVNSSGMTDKSYGQDNYLYAKSNKTSTEARRAFLKFDLSRLVNAEIKSALVYIKTNPRNVSGNPNGDTNIVVSSVYNKIWREDSITWDNHPRETKEKIGEFYFGLPEGGDEWKSIDITDYIKNEPDKIASLVLDTESLSGQNRCYFHSKEKGGDYAPYIMVEYIPSNKEPFIGTNVYSPSADTYVDNSSNTKNKNHGTEPFLYVRSTDSVNEERRGFIRFSCPEFIGSEVDSATLYIKSCPQAVNGTIQRDTNIHFTELQEKYWGETVVTWNNQPTDTGGKVGSLFYEQVDHTWYRIDVTDYLNRQPDKAISLLITTEDTSKYSRCYFYSKEAPDEKDRPYLEVQSGFKNSGVEYSFADKDDIGTEKPVTGGSVAFKTEVRSKIESIDKAVLIGAVYDGDGTLSGISMEKAALENGLEQPLSCKINNIGSYDKDKTFIKAFLFSGTEGLCPLTESGRYIDPDKPAIRNGRINVISPGYRDTIDDKNTVITLYAPSVDRLSFECAVVPESRGISTQSRVFAGNVIPGKDGLVKVDFPAGEFPYGPISILIKGERGGMEIRQYLQLYNKAGVHYDMGMPDTPVHAQGMSVAFYDDFNEMPGISRNGKTPSGQRTTYSSHTPYGGDYGEAKFEDFEGVYNPFEQTDGFLKIKCRKPEGYQASYGREYYGGLLSTLHPDGSGRSWTMGYFECRMFFPPGYGPWPSFWLLSKNRLDSGPRFTTEVDIVEGYMYEPHIPRINYPRWSFVDGEPNTAQSLKDFDMTGQGMLDMAQWFHTYACKITEDYVYIYIDDVEVAKFTTDEETKGPMFLMMNLALGKGGGGVVDLSEYGNGADLYIDYVRVFTP